MRFGYSDERGAALKGVSFDVRAGERIGIVGYSGSGKSTIVKLLLRFYDADAGTIRIGGHDVTTLAADHIRDQIAVVQQDTYLFTDRSKTTSASPVPTRHRNRWRPLRMPPTPINLLLRFRRAIAQSSGNAVSDCRAVNDSE